MGIPGLWGYIEDHAPGCSTLVNEFAGKSVAIDAAVLITAAFKMTITEEPGWEWGFVREVLRRLETIHAMNLHIVMVLDGPGHPLKRGTHEIRESRRRQAERKLLGPDSENLSKEERLKALRASAVLGESLRCILERTMLAAGVAVVKAPHDAEAFCAHLCRTGAVWAVASEDSDCFVFGAPRVVRHLVRNDSSCAESRPRVFEADRMMQELNISWDDLIHMAVMCGSDFNAGIRGIGLSRSLKIVRACSDQTLRMCVDKARKTPEEGAADAIYEGCAAAAHLFRARMMTQDDVHDIPTPSKTVDTEVAFLMLLGLMEAEYGQKITSRRRKELMQMFLPALMPHYADSGGLSDTGPMFLGMENVMIVS